MKIRLAKKIMNQMSLYKESELKNNSKFKGSDYWLRKFKNAEEYDWDNPYSCSGVRGYFDPPALNYNRVVDHRITKAISLTSKKKRNEKSRRSNKDSSK